MLSLYYGIIYCLFCIINYDILNNYYYHECIRAKGYLQCKRVHNIPLWSIWIPGAVCAVYNVYQKYDYIAAV